MLLIGSDGVHIVTDQTAVIEGATPPIEGQVTISALAVNKGAAGNISAGDISGACCRENIFAYNSHFQGGADERDYSVVTKQDIHSVVSTILPHLTESIQATFQKQVQPGETLTPNQCSQKISPDRNAGDEATQVTVIISESCLAGAYNTGDLQAKIRQALAQRATQTIGKGYLLSTYAPISPMKVRIQQDTLVMKVIFQGTMIYQFSQQDLQNLRHQLAGKTKQQAVAILAHLNGIERVYLQVKGTNEKLPINAANITFLFVVENQ
jgi:hypothetical protein